MVVTPDEILIMIGYSKQIDILQQRFTYTYMLHCNNGVTNSNYPVFWEWHMHDDLLLVRW